MTVLLVGEVNVDITLYGAGERRSHWNTAGVKRTKGGMVWNCARALDALGITTAVYAPHGQEFARAEGSLSGGHVLPQFDDLRQDNLCINLCQSAQGKVTVYVPSEVQASQFKMIDQIAEQHMGAPSQQIEALFIASTEETFKVLAVEKSHLGARMFVSLSHVVRYWSPASLAQALKWADVVFVNMDEFHVLQERLGEGFSASVATGPEYLIITDGPNGVSCIGRHRRKRFGTPFGQIARVRDVGAGDTFAGGFVFGYLRDLDLTRGVLCGQVAAYEWVSRGVVPSRSRLDELMSAAGMLEEEWHG